MSIHNLEHLFRPSSIAVIGASDRPHSIGAAVMHNLLEAGFPGPIMPVNPARQAVRGVLAYPSVEALPITPELALLCIPAAAVPEEIRRLGARGTRAAVILSGRMSDAATPGGAALAQATLEAAKRCDMRVLGPNSLGLLVPTARLNASASPVSPAAGRIAFVSQSGALGSAVLDWAGPRRIGFSHFISLGDASDIGFGDVLDYLGSDPSTRAILLYIESIGQRRNFMSAARAAARNKPVLAIKTGRVAGRARSPSHTAALTTGDAVYDGALRRAGMLRVYDLEEMFTAVETLSLPRPMRGNTLTMVTNSGAIGVMALDKLVELSGRPAELSSETIERLNRVAPGQHGNPVDLDDDAGGERYVKAVEILLNAQEVDSLLIMHAPTAVTSSTEIAEQVARTAKANRANIMACWVGQEKVTPARQLLRENGIPTYETPGAAVRAFMHLADYRKNQEMLIETPASALEGFSPDLATARRIVKSALGTNQGLIPETHAKAVIRAYGIPTVETHFARLPADAGRIAVWIDGPVALKIVSPDIPHKSEVGGVMLNLKGADEVEKAAALMFESVVRNFPEARIQGFTVEQMARRAGAQEIIIGVTTDRLFGPVIMFGQGGTAVEVVRDAAFGLPPLNMSLARELVQRTRVWKLLQGYGGNPPANLDAICETLMKVSQMIIDLPEIVEVDINPLFANADGVLALDARVRVGPVAAGAERLAIRPYPKELEETMTLADGRRVFVRPIRPEDEPNHHVFVSKMTPEDIRFRFFGLVKQLPHSEMARFTQIDYDREMAFIAIQQQGGRDETVGVVRAVADPDNQRAEFAVVVTSELKGTGLARMLMMKMIVYCLQRGIGELVGQVLSDNFRMLKFVEALGFRRQRQIEGDIVEVAMDLHAPGLALQNTPLKTA